MSGGSSTRLRWLKFSLVGAIGIGVQLGVLALLTRWHVHYLLATLLAVECAVMHNFVWHERFTWRERVRGEETHICQNRADVGHLHVLKRLVRFHLANAAISVGGNLLLMRLLVGQIGLPVVLANLISIAACYVANFLASDRWVFIAPNGNQFVDCAARSPISSSVRWEKGT
ncbi:MAG: GtrA family protein [Terriglobales bacterium]